MTLEVFSDFNGSVILCSGTCRLWLMECLTPLSNMHRGAVMRQAEPRAGTFAPSLHSRDRDGSSCPVAFVEPICRSPSQMVRVKSRLALNPALPAARMCCNTREKNLKGQIPPECNFIELGQFRPPAMCSGSLDLNIDVFKGINV